MAQDSFTHTAVAPAPLSDVWDALDQPSTWEAIGGVDRVLDPSIDEDGRLRGFEFEVLAGGRRYSGRATPMSREHHRLMSWSVQTAEVSGVTSVALAPDTTGTRITVRLDVESKGVLAAVFFPMITATIGSGLPHSVDRFAEGFAQ